VLRIPSEAFIGDARRELGTWAKIQLLHLFQDIQKKRLVLGSDGTTIAGTSVEAFVIHRETENGIETLLLDIIEVAQQTAEDIFDVFMGILEELNELAQKLELPTIKLEDFVGVMSDHAGTPLAFAQRIRARLAATNPEKPLIDIFGCAIHKATNVAAAMIKFLDSLNKDCPVSNFVTYICKLLTHSSKPYNKAAWWKAFLHRKREEKVKKYWKLIRGLIVNVYKFLKIFPRRSTGSAANVLTSEVLRCHPQLLNKKLIIHKDMIKFLIQRYSILGSFFLAYFTVVPNFQPFV
jgi:hypothetical protein